jgi:GT2 family glycosyltransferase
MMDLSVCTLVRDRNRYLPALLDALARQTVRPRELIVAVAGGQDPAPLLREAPLPVRQIDLVAPDDRIPYAEARNAAAAAAQGEALVFLDADCLPAASFTASVTSALGPHDALCIGQVYYLPPDVPDEALRDEEALREAGRAHPARPEPPETGSAASRRYEMAWGLCMALRTATFFRLGGFDTRYDGYAGEDTDLAFTCRAAGVPLRVVAGADVFHQHHDVFEPPIHQLRATLANAQAFHDKWGRWPMEGWLQGFADAGLVRWHPGAERATLLREPTRAEVERARRRTAAPFRLAA